MNESIININYWKEINNEITNTLKDINGVILLSHNSVEFSDIVDFLNKVRPNHFMNVLYISLTRSYNYMKSTLKLKPLDQKKISFIDCVSGFAFPSEENIDECFYHKPPSNLEEIKTIIKFGIEKSNPDIIVLDSLSQFINFSKPTKGELNDLYNFLKTIREEAVNLIQSTFVLLYDNKLGIMQNLPKNYTDIILKLEILKEESNWGSTNIKYYN
jgi:hypothetical protein